VFLRNSISVLLHLPLSPSPLFLCHAPPPLSRPCAALPPPPRRSEPFHTFFPASLPPSPTPRWPSLLLPRRTTVRSSHPSPLLAVVATPRHLLLPNDPTCRSPTGRCRSLSPAAILRARHANPAATRASPCRHARRWHASSCLRADTSSSGSRALPTASLALALAFACLHFAQFLLLQSPPSPDLRRISWPPSSATHATPGLQSSATRASP
jgi:hypothetical protein